MSRLARRLRRLLHVLGPALFEFFVFGFQRNMRLPERVRSRRGATGTTRSRGAYGRDGEPIAGQMIAGLALGGPLRADASRGTAGVFINGRQI